MAKVDDEPSKMEMERECVGAKVMDRWDEGASATVGDLNSSKNLCRWLYYLRLNSE